MAYYMIQAAYSTEAWASQVASPQNRLEQLEPVFSRIGGSIESAYFTYGDYDIVANAQLPDNTAAAALSLAAASSGSVKSLKTTPLMTIEEGVDAMRQAGGSGYRPPES